MAFMKEDYFFQGDPETTAEYAESIRRKAPFSGEKLLMLAVLEEAIESYKRNLLATDRKAQNLFTETEQWIWTSGEDALFSFENVCEALNLDADYLRSGLSRWKEEQFGSRKESAPKTRSGKPRRGKRVA